MFFTLMYGCSTQNPLCNDLYCVEGKIYPKSELAPGDTFTELAIDINEKTLIDTILSSKDFYTLEDHAREFIDRHSNAWSITIKDNFKVLDHGSRIQIGDIDALCIMAHEAPFHVDGEDILTHGSIFIKILPNDDIEYVFGSYSHNQVCGYSGLLHQPGTYQIIADLTVNGVRDLYTPKDDLVIPL